MPNGHDWEIKDRLYEEIVELKKENKRLWKAIEWAIANGFYVDNSKKGVSHQQWRKELRKLAEDGE